MTDDQAMPVPEAVLCRAVKHGGVDLTCELPDRHDESPEGTWHHAVFTERRELTYAGARHVIEMTETVTWEPVDHVKESVRMLLKDKR